MSKSPASPNSLLVLVDNVVQEPGVAFTLSDNTLTLTEAPDTGSDNIYAVFWGGTLTITETSTVKTANSATITGNLVPTSNVVFSLGEPASAWKELYLDANSLHLGNTSVSIGKTGEVEFMKTNKLGQPVTNRDIANVHASIDAGGVLSFYSANTTGNVRFARGTAIGYANSKVPGANLDVHGNTYISGATTIAGASLGLGTNLTGHPNPQLEIVKNAQAHVRVAGVIGGTGQTTGGTNSYQNTTPQFDFADAQNWRITLANNVTFGRPWNCNEGQTGSIFILQDGTGSRTGSFSSDWLFAAGTVSYTHLTLPTNREV